MAIYKGGQSQFGLHEAANEESYRNKPESWHNGVVIAGGPEWSKVRSLQNMYERYGEATPISGAGLAAGKRQVEKG